MTTGRQIAAVDAREPRIVGEKAGRRSVGIRCAAVLLEVSERTARRWCETGLLAAERVGERGWWKVPREEIARVRRERAMWSAADLAEAIVALRRAGLEGAAERMSKIGHGGRSGARARTG